MSTVAEIEDAMNKLPLSEKLRLWELLGKTVSKEQPSPLASSSGHTHSVRDIPTISVGTIIKSDPSRDDVLAEMLEARF